PPRAASRSTRFRRGKLLKSLTRCTLTIVQQIRYPLVKEHDQPGRFRFDGSPAHRGSPCRDRKKAVRAGRSEVGRTVYRPRRACSDEEVAKVDPSNSAFCALIGVLGEYLAAVEVSSLSGGSHDDMEMDPRGGFGGGGHRCGAALGGWAGGNYPAGAARV